MKKLMIAAMAAAMAFNAQALITRTTVQQGEIEGVEHEGAALYKKIPYAEAPVGELRWKAPVPKKAWTGVYYADEWGNRPTGTNSGFQVVVRIRGNDTDGYTYTVSGIPDGWLGR